MACSVACHTGFRTLLVSSRVVHVSPSPRVLADAMPIAASALSQRMPPCSVPMGLACCAPAANAIHAWPGAIDVSVKSISMATGSSELSPRQIRCTGSNHVDMLSLLALSVSLVPCHGPTRRLVPGTSPDGACYNRGIDHKGHSHGGKDGDQAPAPPAAGDPAPTGGHHQPDHASHEWPQQPSDSL